MQSNYSRKLVPALLLAALLLAGTAFSQARRGGGGAAGRPAAPAPSKPDAKACGWSGVITYTKAYTQNERSERPTGYVSSKSDFLATAEVSVGEDGSARAKVNVKITGLTEDVKEGSDCCMISLAGCSRKGGFRAADIVGTETQAEASAAVGGVSFEGDSFSAHVSLPAAAGTTVRTLRTVRKRECDDVDQDVSQRQQAAASYAVGPIRIEAAADPRNPNVIRGTQTDGDVTITYDLARCGGGAPAAR